MFILISNILVIIARLYPPARHLLFVCVKRLRVLPGALRQRLYNYQRLRVFYDSVTFAFRLTAAIIAGAQPL